MFCTSVLASGSKGNCFFIKNNDTQILIDAGISHKNYAAALETLGVNHYKLDCIFISHLHHDHVSGVGVIGRKTGANIYVSNQNYYYFLEKKLINENTQNTITFKTGDQIIVGDLIVHPFSSSHDSIDSCNFIISCAHDNEKKMAIVTDTGYATELLKHNLKNVSIIIIESNHDITMLKNGPYDWKLKQRIMSRTGHLSNEQCTNLIEEIINDNHKIIILAHLSEINNTPEKARITMEEMLKRNKRKIELHISNQYQNTKLFEII
jgi:phosphoribosyl 1,2-cyclic phosphodiesterase